MTNGINGIDVAGIAAMASALVKIPSRGGEDSPAAVLNFLHDWLSAAGLEPNYLRNSSGAVGILVKLSSRQPGEILCLNAPTDTAPFGDVSRWCRPPTSGLIVNGCLYGRGSADAKIAVAMFCHLATDLKRSQWIKRGELQLLFDADEHTGGFSGVKQFLMASERLPSAVVVGYPGNRGIVIGARGFLRVNVTGFGISEHSGSKRKAESNAVIKMARLVEMLNDTPLPRESDNSFSFGPRATVTAMHGGGSFSQVPDQCSCSIDLRLTPNFDRAVALEWMAAQVKQLDQVYRSPKETVIDVLDSWPPYRLKIDHPIVQCFVKAASASLGRVVPPIICGPSNIGNFLSTYAIPAICGFGLSYEHTHSVNEYVDLRDLAAVYRAYREAVTSFLS